MFGTDEYRLVRIFAMFSCQEYVQSCIYFDDNCDLALDKYDLCTWHLLHMGSSISSLLLDTYMVGSGRRLGWKVLVVVWADMNR